MVKTLVFQFSKADESLGSILEKIHKLIENLKKFVEFNSSDSLTEYKNLLN